MAREYLLLAIVAVERVRWGRCHKRDTGRLSRAPNLTSPTAWGRNLNCGDSVRCAARRSGAVCRSCQIAAPHTGDPTEGAAQNYQRIGAGERGARPAGLGALPS